MYESSFFLLCFGLEVHLLPAGLGLSRHGALITSDMRLKGFFCLFVF